MGYTYLYDKMVETGAIFGTETSGHVYFKVSDAYYTESAAYALVVLLKLLDRRNKRLSELVKPLAGRYFQSGEINIEIEDKDGAMQRIEENFAGGRISRLDGVSVEYDDFWFNIRPSNTEPLLRLRLEARSKVVRERRTEEVLALVNQ
ncbi:Phosphomannomutase/phosphoglucomutase [subsurface metagenome]